MKLSKKVTSVALASVLAMSMVVSGFAADGKSKQGGDTPTPTPTTVVTPTPTPTPTPKPTTVVTPTPTPTPAPETPSGAVSNGVIKTSDVKNGEVVYGQGKLVKKNLAGADGLKTLVVDAKKITFGKNCLKGSSIKKVVGKSTKASKYVFKGKAGKNGVKLVVPAKMSDKEFKKLKKKAKKAGIKVVRGK